MSGVDWVGSGADLRATDKGSVLCRELNQRVEVLKREIPDVPVRAGGLIAVIASFNKRASFAVLFGLGSIDGKNPPRVVPTPLSDNLRHPDHHARPKSNRVSGSLSLPRSDRGEREERNSAEAVRQYSASRWDNMGRPKAGLKALHTRSR
jgi:hypothetical protein